MNGKSGAQKYMEAEKAIIQKNFKIFELKDEIVKLRTENEQLKGTIKKALIENAGQFYDSMTIFIFGMIILIGIYTLKLVPDAILIPALILSAIGVMCGVLGMNENDSSNSNDLREMIGDATYRKLNNILKKGNE